MRLEAIRLETHMAAPLASGTCCSILALREVKVEANRSAPSTSADCTFDAPGSKTGSLTVALCFPFAFAVEVLTLVASALIEGTISGVLILVAHWGICAGSC